MIPPDILRVPTPSLADAQLELVRIAARALGAFTRADVADYFRISQSEAAAAIALLVDAREIVAIEVPGWPGGYAVSDLRIPRKVEHSALLAPFDPLIWFRARTERLFGMRYRIGIYTPAHKREHGYYVLPFLHDGHLVARVDLKADRAAGRLLVKAAHGESHCTSEAVLALARELRSMAGWLGLSDVVVAEVGELAPAVAGALR